MHSSDSSLQQKQSYVYQKIMQAQYDVQAFAQYLASLPPMYSSNLEQVSLQTVKQAVDNFIKPQQKPTQLKTLQRQSVAFSQSNPGNRISIDYNTIKFYQKSRECIKQINKFALTNINLNVISFKKNQGGFFSRDFITYKIQLPQLHRAIDRRYSDFQWLRNILRYYHPYIVIPSLPKKKMKKIFTQDHLKKKGRMLQNFLRKCLEIPDLRNDQNLYRFLAIQNNEKFQQYKKLNKVQRGILPLQKIKSATGKIQYGITMDIINTNKKGIQYFRNLSPVMKLLYKQIKRVEQSLNVCADHLKNLQQLSKKLIPVQEQFRRSCGRNQYFQDEERQRNFFQNIGLVAQRYKDQLKGMKQIWQKELYTKMKYQFHHAEQFNETLNNYQSLQKDFFNMTQKLRNKKLKLYARPINQWDITQQQKTRFMAQKPTFVQVAPLMMLKKTQQMAQFEFKYALYTKQLNNSIVHYAKHNNLYNMKNLQRFLQRQYALENQWVQDLSHIITKIFQFSLVQLTTKDKLMSTGSSIKGFFSQYKGPNGDKSNESKVFKSQFKNN